MRWLGARVGSARCATMARRSGGECGTASTVRRPRPDRNDGRPHPTRRSSSTVSMARGRTGCANIDGWSAHMRVVAVDVPGFGDSRCATRRRLAPVDGKPPSRRLEAVCRNPRLGPGAAARPPVRRRVFAWCRLCRIDGAQACRGGRRLGSAGGTGPAGSRWARAAHGRHAVGRTDPECTPPLDTARRASRRAQAQPCVVDVRRSVADRRDGRCRAGRERRGRPIPGPVQRSTGRPDLLLEALFGMTLPVLAIWGDRDALDPDVNVRVDALQGIAPAARAVVVPEAGHWVGYKSASLVNGHVLRWVKEH